MPITWQNINAPSNDGVMRGLALASQELTSAFDRIGSGLDKQRTANQAVVDRADDSNVLALKEALASARTPEEVAGLTDQLAQMRAGLSNKGRTAVLGAEDARTTALQQQITAGNAFKDGLVTREHNNELGRITRPVALLDAEANANNAPITRELARDALLQRQKLEPLVNATAITTAENAGRSARFTATQAPSVEANQVLRTDTENKTLTSQRNQAQDSLDDQGLEALTARTAAAYRDTQQADRLKLGELAAKRGIPVDAAGAPDVTRMTTAQKTQLNADAGLAGLRSIGDLFEGDTKAMNSFIRDLTAEGKFAPEVVSRNVAKIQGAFNTSSAGAPIGNDAAKIARDQAVVDVLQKERDARNWYAPGSPDATTAYESLATEVDGMFGPNEREDLPHVQALLADIAANGIKTKDGKKVVPPREVILGAVRSTYEGWNIRNRGRSEDIADQIRKAVSTSNVNDLLLQAEDSKIENRKRAVREILAPPPAPVKK